MAVSVEQVKELMYKLIKDSVGMKKWKATDLHKACEEMYGADYDKRKIGKVAIKELIEEGKLVINSLLF